MSNESERVAITKTLAARREFWVAVIVAIAAVVVIVLAVLLLYPEVLSEIVDLWDEEPEPVIISPRLMEPYEYERALWPQIEATLAALGTPTVTP